MVLATVSRVRNLGSRVAHMCCGRAAGPPAKPSYIASPEQLRAVQDDLGSRLAARSRQWRSAVL